jgi:oligoribonuclease
MNDPDYMPVQWALENGLNCLNQRETDKTDANLLWVDIETTGLETKTDMVLEIGAVMTDFEGYVIAEPINLLIHDPRFSDRLTFALDGMIPLVREMHEKSGLLAEVDKKLGFTFLEAELELTRYVRQLTDDEPGKVQMAGSTIKFDYYMLREFMPRFVNLLHYRAVDVSTVKTLCQNFNPGVYKRLGEQHEPKKLHRPLPDLVDSINEYAFYTDNFLLWGGGE